MPLGGRKESVPQHVTSPLVLRYSGQQLDHHRAAECGVEIGEPDDLATEVGEDVTGGRGGDRVGDHLAVGVGGDPIRVETPTGDPATALRDALLLPLMGSPDVVALEFDPLHSTEEAMVTLVRSRGTMDQRMGAVVPARFVAMNVRSPCLVQATTSTVRWALRDGR